MASRDEAVIAPAYWRVPLARAVPLGILAIFIAFSADHSPRLGLLAFGGFAVVSGLLLAVLTARTLERGTERTLFTASSVISLATGGAALAWPDAGQPYLVLLLSAWAVLTGGTELFLGLRDRRRHAAARDWSVVGGMTLLLGIVVLVFPPDLAQRYTGPDGIARVLDSSVVIVGVLGAYAAIAAVFLAIAGISLKSVAASAPQDGARS